MKIYFLFKIIFIKINTLTYLCKKHNTAYL